MIPSFGVPSMALRVHVTPFTSLVHRFTPLSVHPTHIQTPPPLLRRHSRCSFAVRATAASPSLDYDFDSHAASTPSCDWSSSPYSSSALPLRQHMLDCHSPPQLLALIQDNYRDMGPSEVAAAWHVAVQAKLLSSSTSSNNTDSHTNNDANPSSASLVSLLLKLTDRFVETMDPASLATTAWALASSSHGSQQTMHKLLDTAQRTLIHFLPPQLCVLLWASATHPALATDPPLQLRLFHALADLIDGGMRLELFSPSDLSLLLQSMAKARYIHASIITAAEMECLAKIDAASPSDTARILYGFAALQHNPMTLRRELESRLGSREALEAFSPEEVAMMMVGYGKTHVVPDTKMLRALLRRLAILVPTSGNSNSGGGGEPIGPVAKRKYTKKSDVSNNGVPDTNTDATAAGAAAGAAAAPQYLNSKHVAHCVWALGRINYQTGDNTFISRALRHFVSCPGAYSGEEVSAMVWGAVTMEVKIADDVLACTARRAAFLATRENEEVVASMLQQIAAAAAAAATTTVLSPKTAAYCRKFASMAAVLLAPTASRMSPSQLASIIVALGTLEIRKGEVPASTAIALHRACLSSVREFSSEVLPRVAWATVRLHWNNLPQVGDAIAIAAAVRAPLMSAEGLAQMAWSFAAMERPHHGVAKVLVEECMSKVAYFSTQDKVRLAWALSHIAVRHPEVHPIHISRVIEGITKSEMKYLDPVAVSAIIWTCGRLMTMATCVSTEMATAVKSNVRIRQVVEAGAVCMRAKRRLYSQEQLEMIQSVVVRFGDGKDGGREGGGEVV